MANYMDIRNMYRPTGLTDERDGLLFLIALTAELADLHLTYDLEYPDVVESFDMILPGISSTLRAFTAKFPQWKRIVQVEDAITSAYDISTHLPDIRDKQIEEVNRLYRSLPGAEEQHPYRHIIGGGTGEEIGIFTMLGFPPSTKEAMRDILIHPYLTVEQWKNLLSNGFPLCIPSDVCEQVMTTSLIQEEHERVFRLGITSYPELRNEKYIPHPCDPLSKIILEFFYESEELEHLPMDDILRGLSKPCISSRTGEVIPIFIRHLKLRGEQQRFLIFPGEITDLEILEKIQDAISTSMNRTQYSTVMREMSLQPASGRYPGGEEYRQARERQSSMMRVITRQDIENIKHKWHTLYSPTEKASSLVEEKMWEDIIPLANSAGILEFKRKEDVLTLIAICVKELLQDIDVNIPSREFVSKLFGVNSLNVPDIQAAIIAWASRITLATEWSMLIRITNALKITNIPDTPEGLATYLQEYITQY